MKFKVPLIIFLFYVICQAAEFLPPKDGQARVYILNTSQDFEGSKFPCLIFADDQYLGMVKKYECRYVDLEPGSHKIWATVLGIVSFVEASVSADNIYFIAIEAVTGSFVPVPRPVMKNACPKNKEGWQYFERYHAPTTVVNRVLQLIACQQYFV